MSAIPYKAKFVLATTLETPDLGTCVAKLRPMRKKQLGAQKIGPKVEKKWRKKKV